MAGQLSLDVLAAYGFTRLEAASLIRSAPDVLRRDIRGGPDPRPRNYGGPVGFGIGGRLGNRPHQQRTQHCGGYTRATHTLADVQQPGQDASSTSAEPVSPWMGRA